MEILQSIGLNQTIVYQIVIFLVTFVAINNLVFKPYFNAYEERKRRTVGNTHLAAQALEETKNLELEYEAKARTLNSEQKSLYDKTRADAMHEYDEIVNSAREKAKTILNKNRSITKIAVDKASEELTKEIPAVSAVIATKLLGKEIKA